MIKEYKEIKELNLRDTNITHFVCDNEIISHLNVSKNPNLDHIQIPENVKYLDISNTKISLDNIKYSTSINTLICRSLYFYDVITNDDLYCFKNFDNLVTLDIGYIKLYLEGDFILSDYFKCIKHLCLYIINEFKIIDDLHTLETLEVSGYEDGLIECPELKKLTMCFTKVDIKNIIKNNKLTELEISSRTASENYVIENIDFLKHLSELSTLKLYRTYINCNSKFPRLEKVKTLKLFAMTFTNEMAINLPSLENLDIDLGDIEHGSLHHTKNLLDLNICGIETKLNEDDISNMNKLERLSLDSSINNINKRLFSGITSLTYLKLHKVKNIKKDSFDDLINLNTLIIKGPPICKGLFSKLNNLLNLDITLMDTDDLEFDGLYNLRSLKIDLDFHDRYRNIKKYEITLKRNLFTPLSNLESFTLLGEVTIENNTFNGLECLGSLVLNAANIKTTKWIRTFKALNSIEISSDSKYPKDLIQKIEEYDNGIYQKVIPNNTRSGFCYFGFRST